MTAGARYTAVAVALHWAIAAAILANLLLGWWMTEAIEDPASQAGAIAGYQLHKSIGLSILVLSVLRLLWRLTHKAPPLPGDMPDWQRWAARTVQGALYALMIVVPLSGWTYVSAQWRDDGPLNVPTLWFGLFEVPHLFDAGAMALDERKAVAARNLAAHFWLAWSMGGLFVLHAAAALRHHFLRHDAVMASMLPDRRSGIAAALLAAALAGLCFVSASAPERGDIESSGAWRIDPASEIAFAGTHAGIAFRGRFTRWDGDIRFDARAPRASSIGATVETASAHDGVPLHDESLPQAEWFDSKTFPQATYRSTRIVPKRDGSFDVEGVLEIKGRELKVPALSLRPEGGTLTITGKFEIDRKDANLGQESDPDGEFVSRSIDVDVRVLARRS